MEQQINMSHGSGAYASHKLVQELIFSKLHNPLLDEQSDQAILRIGSNKLAFSTDSFVVSPLFFPGGNIGSLSVHGTLNDLAMSGAKPLYLSLALIIEEGFSTLHLEQIIDSIAEAARQNNVHIVTGDTKVVEKGKGDGLFINTTGIGIIEHKLEMSQNKIKAGDKIIINGSIGDHGISILQSRHELGFNSNVCSDSQSLAKLSHSLCSTGLEIKYMRDPTRGGLAATLNEIAHYCNLSVHLQESKIPMKQEVTALCETLGLDILTLANEGKMLVFCSPHDAERVLEHMKGFPEGQDSCIIGELTTPEMRPQVELITSYGGKRLVSWNFGDPLPRIC